VADFTEVNEKFNYKVYFDDFSENSMSLDDLGSYEWGYMHYISGMSSSSSILYSPSGDNTDFFPFETYCVDVERNWGLITKQDRKINGKIFRRIEGLLPIYVKDNVSQNVKEKLKEAITEWNKVFAEIGIDNKIKLYYAGEVVENNYFYNAINNDWRGIYTVVANEPTIFASGEVIENSFWNDIDDSFKLYEATYSAIVFPNLYQFDEWKAKVDEIMNLYPDGVFYVEYKYDENGNPVDFGAVISQIGKPMKAIILNGYYESRDFFLGTIMHEIGHALHFYHPFRYEVFYPDYIYISDLKGKESVMNYYDNEDYPRSPYPSEFDKEVLRYIYNFQTSEEITIDNVSEFLREKCGL